MEITGAPREAPIVLPCKIRRVALGRGVSFNAFPLQHPVHPPSSEPLYSAHLGPFPPSGSLPQVGRGVSPPLHKAHA